MHEVVTFIAKYFLVLSVIGAIWVWWRLTFNQKKQFIALAVAGAIFSLILAEIGKHLHSDPRPFVVGHFTPYFPHGNDNGFPSDHTLLTAFLAFTVWRYSKRAGWALLGVSVLVGLCRMIAGVHHLQDIIGSIIFAWIGVWLAWKFVDNFLHIDTDRPRQRRTQPDLT